MRLKLVGPVQGAEHGEVEQAARLERKALAAPDGAPAILGGQLLHGHVEVVRGRERLVDEVLTDDALADLEPALVALLVHLVSSSVRVPRSEEHTSELQSRQY